MRITTILLFIVLLNACKGHEVKFDLDYKIVAKIIEAYNLKNSNAYIIEAKQGIFAYDTLSIDTARFYYSGFEIGKIYVGKASLKNMYSNLFYFKDAPGLFEFTDSWKYNNINGIPILENCKIKNFIIRDSTKRTSSNIYIIDWDKLKKCGIGRLYSFSNPILNKRLKFGFIGFQIYSKENFSVNVIEFPLTDSLKIKKWWSINLKVLNYDFVFLRDSLKHFGPNAMVVK
jgi:hypothetical protein